MDQDSPAAPGAMTRLLEELVRTQEVPVAEAWLKPPAPGDRIGRFELLREIGHGGFGVVFEARDGELGREVAFKALRPARAIAPGQAELLRAEAEAAARLNHPAIVTVHDFGT
ncbi:MAG: serine/threonine protein kinase, partial [Anaeromyxobacteraceae bacterium]|nr:serine/threonine protein kinase [Anaeromyxobacteraceae bacterium]